MSRYFLFFFGVICIAQNGVVSEDGFELLFNEKNWDGWHLKLRNGDKNMANEIFSIEENMVHVFKNSPDSLDFGTGENGTHGLFYINKKYSKYILKFEYKWGSKIANNFERWQYDAGVYYHVVDDKVWPTGIEYQIRYNHTEEKNHTGDLIRPQGVTYDWYRMEKSNTFLHPKDGGVLEKKSEKKWLHLASPTNNHNALNGQWNECEIIVMGNQYTIHKLNGEIVNMAFNLNPSSGIIGFQSETAEIYYRDIKIKEFDSVVPAEAFFE